MNSDQSREAARLIGEARTARRRIRDLPERCRPTTLDDAYDIQAALSDWRGDHGEGPPVGYKIGCTNAAMQDMLGVPHPAMGRIHEAGCHRPGAVIDAAGLQMPGAECEIAVRIGADVPAAAAPYDRATIADFISACMPAMEIVDNRHGDWRTVAAAIMAADDFFHAGCVLGAEAADWRTLDLSALDGRIVVDGDVRQTGRSDQVMGHPFEAVAWLANTLGARGATLKAGDFVMTGTIAPVHWIESTPCEVAVEIEGLGAVPARFA